MQRSSVPVMSGREALDLLERLAIRVDFPEPCLLNDVRRVVEDPNKPVPVVVRCFGNPGYEAARFAAGSISFDLIPSALVLKVMALLYGRSASHCAGVLVL